jgi:DNA polymerase I-like protein with 3'-5' exonuclease and polymerase domains
MKKALVIFKELLTVNQIPHKFVLNVHDEWQLEVPKQHGISVGELGVSAIQAAGVALGLRCPLDGEYKVGKNWAETH